MTPLLGLARVLALGGVFTALSSLVYWVVATPSSLPHQSWVLYVADVDRRLKLLFAPTVGKYVALGQALALGGAVAGGLLLSLPQLYLLIAPIAVVPRLYIELMRIQRVRAVEAQLDNFIQSLANSLKATPSIGNALSYTQPLLQSPLDVEVALALKEIRLGATLDQALLSMAERIRSVPLDAALSGILVGRQVGGDLPQILQKTAATLREMARLQGVIRAKTAEGKAQLVVLALFPFAMLFLFDTVSPGYFVPLTESVVGWFTIAGSVGLWVASLVVARKVLEVNI